MTGLDENKEGSDRQFATVPKGERNLDWVENFMLIWIDWWNGQYTNRFSQMVHFVPFTGV